MNVSLSETYDFVFIGAGPTSLESLRFVAMQDTSRNLRIAVVSPDVLGIPKIQGEESAQKKAPTGISSESLEKKRLLMFKHYSQAFFWGASCLPTLDHETKAPDFKKIFGEIASRWKVQAEEDAMSQLYSLNGTTLGSLQRKELANMVVGQIENGKNFFIGHSRLAISTKGHDRCNLSGQCFTSCPSDSPWNPRKLLLEILNDSPNIVLKEEMVDGIEQIDSKWRISTSLGNSYIAENVVLSAGWDQTSKILQGVSELKFASSQSDLRGTAVTLIPVFIKKRTHRKDFEKSFVYHDLIHVQPKNQLFTQIYLPTHEIAKRTILELRILGRVKHLLSFQEIYNFTIGRHIGIAMVFSESTPIETHKKLESKQIALIKAGLRMSLRPIGGRVINFKKKELNPKESYHVGALGILRERGHALMYGEEGVDPLLPGLHVVGPPLLPDIEPGPHTISAAAISVVYLKRYFENV